MPRLPPPSVRPAVSEDAPAPTYAPVARAAVVTAPVVDGDRGELHAPLLCAAVVAAAAPADATVPAGPALARPWQHRAHIGLLPTDNLRVPNDGE
jgi:hypothetical protein